MHYQKMMKIIWKTIALEWLFYWFLKFTLALIAAMLVLGLVCRFCEGGYNSRINPFVTASVSVFLPEIWLL